MRKKPLVLPPRTVVLFFCLGIVLVAGGLGLFFQAQHQKDLQATLNRLKADTAIQSILQPLHSRVSRIDLNLDTDLPGISKALPQAIHGDLKAAETIFRNIAETADMRFGSMNPDLNSIDAKSGTMTARVFMTGSFKHFQKALVMAGMLPFVSSISNVNIHSETATISYELSVVLSLA